MVTKPPIALIVFSNDLDDYLPNIETERKVIEEALEHYDDTNRLKIITRSSVSIDELFRLFNKYTGRIALFHFAGHAGGRGLQLNQTVTNTQTGKAEGLADLFRREIKQGILKLVFLNGCSTAPQVKALKTAGVPSIIATNYPINDNKAVRVAKQFYRTWTKADDLLRAFDAPFTTILQAFEAAIAYLKLENTVVIQDATRGFMFDIDEVKTNEPWELFTSTPSQTLDFEVAKESKTFNEFLVRRMIERLVSYSRPASKFLPIANKKLPDWETNLAISNKAKEIIVYSFVGVLGIQLQKLFAIGNEEITTEVRQRKYIENSLYTAKRILKLVNFALLSKLWDYRTQALDFKLDDKQRDTIQHFFEDSFEMDILGYFKFLRSLFSVYKNNDIALPFSTENHFENVLASRSSLEKACERLQKIQQAFDKSQIKLSDCFATEKQLVILLETFIFFAEYKMVSIRQINYDEMRNQLPRYIHTFTELGIDAKQNINAEKVKAEENPVTTDAILLHKDRYQNSINLFPFIIDLHTLTFEDKANICFYDSRDFNDGSLNYRFLQNNKVQNIIFENIGAKENIAKVVTTKELFKTLKLDMVHTQFKEAKKAILNIEEEDEFGDLFDLEFDTD